MDKEEGITVEVINWKKFQFRSDNRKYSQWFRFDHSIVDDPQFYDFTHSELWSFVYILALCSRKNSNIVTVNFNHALHVSRLEKQVLIQAVQKLKRNHIVKTRTGQGRYERVTRMCATVQNSTDRTGQDSKLESKSGDLLILLWNEFQDLPKVKTITAHQRKLARDAYQENPSTDFWRGVFSKIQKSAFLTGKSKTGWRADFGWVMSKGNYGRIADDAFTKSDETEEYWKKIFGDDYVSTG